jgi:hypothetical protein
VTREQILTATPERLNEITCLEMGMVPGLPETADWNPVEDIRDAQGLVKELQKQRLIVEITVFENEVEVGIYDKLGYLYEKSRCISRGKTAPEAICKAFLLATEPGN